MRYHSTTVLTVNLRALHEMLPVLLNLFLCVGHNRYDSIVAVRLGYIISK